MVLVRHKVKQQSLVNRGRILHHSTATGKSATGKNVVRGEGKVIKEIVVAPNVIED
jgi:hypothetical protein